MGLMRYSDREELPLDGVRDREAERRSRPGPWSAPTADGPLSARLSLPGSKSLTNRELVLAALEGFHDDGILAGLPLPGVGTVAGASVEDVRAWLRARVADALAAEPALLDLVTRRYLTPGATHEGVLRSTYLSRATYFRRLRRARELLVATPGER